MSDFRLHAVDRLGDDLTLSEVEDDWDELLVWRTAPRAWIGVSRRAIRAKGM